MRLLKGCFNPSAQLNNLVLITRLSLSIFILLLASGCSWLDGKDKSEPPAVIAEIAPQAQFSVAVQSGKAPLVVVFTDTSQAGSSSITSWQWDFGDGGTSALQNPQYTFEIHGTYTVTLTVSSADGTDTSSLAEAVVVAPADTTTKITVVGVRGFPITDVTASSSTFEIIDQNNNELDQFEIILTSNSESGVIRISKEGYIDGLLHLQNSELDQTKVLTLLDRLPPIKVDALMGGEYIGIDGATVVLPEEAFVNANGESVTGTIDLYITPVDISDELKIKAFPGSFYGMPDESTIPAGEDLQQQLFSFGVAAFSFYQNDEKLQLKDGLNAELKLPIYASKDIYDEDLVIGGVIPMWILDEETGVWVQEGQGTIIANPLVASGFSLKSSTTHFTWFNTDIWAYSPSGAGGSGSSVGPGSCRLTITIIGAVEDEYLSFSLTNGFVSTARSTLTQNILWDSFPIETSIPVGALISAVVTQGEKTKQQNLLCFEANASVEIILEEAAPEFVTWNLEALPVFNRETPNDPYTIISNDIIIGGHFINTSQVEVESSLVVNSPFSLLNRRYKRGVVFLETDPSPTIIRAVLSNDFGQDERVTPIEYIAEHSPLLAYFYVVPSLDGVGLEYRWSVEGADSADVYYLGEDPTSIGAIAFRIVDIDADFIVNGQLSGLDGFVRIDFNNQYGQTVKIGRLADLLCSGEACPQ